MILCFNQKFWNLKIYIITLVFCIFRNFEKIIAYHNKDWKKILYTVCIILWFSQCKVFQRLMLYSKATYSNLYSTTTEPFLPKFCLVAWSTIVLEPGTLPDHHEVRYLYFLLEQSFQRDTVSTAFKKTLITYDNRHRASNKGWAIQSGHCCTCECSYLIFKYVCLKLNIYFNNYYVWKYSLFNNKDTSIWYW